MATDVQNSTALDALVKLLREQSTPYQILVLK
jgi:hypothetical protein